MAVRTKATLRALNGYRVIYSPDNPAAMNSDNWSGYVYEHIAIAEKSLGRRLRPDEVVHHLDFNPANNHPSNLLVLLRSQHTKLHEWLKRSDQEKSGTAKIVKACKMCSQWLHGTQTYFCSNKCRGEFNTSDNKPPMNELATAMKSLSFVAMGKKYGVSDNAVRKWARKYGLL